MDPDRKGQPDTEVFTATPRGGEETSETELRISQQSPQLTPLLDS